jgi:hypothetical protein
LPPKTLSAQGFPRHERICCWARDFRQSHDPPQNSTARPRPNTSELDVQCRVDPCVFAICKPSRPAPFDLGDPQQIIRVVAYERASSANPAKAAFRQSRPKAISPVSIFGVVTFPRSRGTQNYPQEWLAVNGREKSRVDASGFRKPTNPGVF